MPPLSKRLAAEALGTGFLLMAIIGSAIMGERLASGNFAIVLLANSLATGAVLFVLILIFGPISGAHFNPAVTLALASQREISRRDAALYIAVQVLAAFTGVAAAHLMFNEPVFFASLKVRAGLPQWAAEFIATFGLLLVIRGCASRPPAITALAVAAYITSAYWFTRSTSFANPAVTMARAASNTFAGIRPEDVVGFVVMQLAAAIAATFLLRWLATPSAAATRSGPPVSPRAAQQKNK